ncbi:WD40 domain containing protein [Pyrrhoderma noxium]|uniref:WD40 domain containing protein n=1 Tax=Pyrrhoderma noxium TaxID=2282107 RepID=A0A286U4Z5_9AGAM|nr:WD40 domain containing protein [Pyrrhoderma noxium]
MAFHTTKILIEPLSTTAKLLTPLEMSNHSVYISPIILDQLRHLEMSDSFDMSKSTFVAGGGFSDVYKAEHHFPGRPTSRAIAIKKLRFYLKEDITMLFEKEIIVWSRLQHANIVPLLGYTFDINTGYPLLISEWMENGSAWVYINCNPNYDALKLICDIAKGLAYLHDKKIVHSDIKTDNVLISSSGTAMICDFGLARAITSSKSFMTNSSGNKGTVRYLAYELVALPDEYSIHTTASDVWAFGMVVYELVTRKRAYGEKSEYQVLGAIFRQETPIKPTFDQLIHQVADNFVFQNLVEICSSCWEFEPQKRFNMTEILILLSFLCNPSISESISTLDFPPVDSNQRIELIIKNAKLLNSTEFHSSILESVFRCGDWTTHTFRGVFSLIFFSKSPLSDLDIDAILELETDTTSSLLACLQPLVKHEKGKLIEIQDAFLYDYLVSCKEYRWYIDAEVQKAYIASRCLERMGGLLRHNICDIPSSYVLNSDVPDLDNRVTRCIPPLLKYICCNWAHHLRDVPYSQDLCSQLRSFAHNQLLFWFEILSLTDTFDDHVGPALLLSVDWVGNNDPELSSFLRDAYRLASIYSEPISKSRVQIYDSLLPLTRDNSPMSMHYSKYASNKFQVEYIGRKQRVECIKTIQVSREWVREILPQRIVLFSPDGTRLLTNTSFGVCVYEATSGKLIAGPLAEVDGTSVLSATYSSDGRYIVVASEDYVIRKWDTFTNCLVWETEIDGGQIDLSRVMSAEFSPDAKSVVFGDYQRSIWVWNVETGNQDGETLKGHTGSVNCLSFSSEGRYLASGSDDATVIIWDMDRREVKTRPLKKHTESVTAVNFSPSGKNVVSGSKDATVLVWNAFNGDVLREIKCEDVVYSVTYSPDELLLLAGGYKWMSMWDVADATAASKVFQADMPNWSVSFSSDSNRFVSASSWVCRGDNDSDEQFVDGKIQTWDATWSVNETKLTFEEKSEILSITLSPSGRFTVTVPREDINNYLWCVLSGEIVKTKKNSSSTSSVSFSPINDQLIAFGSYDGTVEVWDVTHDKSVTNRNHKGKITSLAFSPSDGMHLASCSWDKTICIWNVERRELAIGPLTGHEDQVLAVAYSPDGTKLVSGSEDKTVRIWDSVTGDLLSTLDGHSQWVQTVAYSFDGSHIVSGSGDKTILVWNAQSGEIVGEPITGHSNWVSSVCFSPDGKRVLSGSEDNTASVWDAVTGQPLFPPFRGHTEPVRTVFFFPDGRRFATGSRDGAIRIWTLDTTQNDTDWDLRDDNWIVNKNGKLMMWIPTDLRTRLYSPRCTSILNRSYRLKLKLNTEWNIS